MTAGNRYRHPDPGLLARLERAGVTVRRTDTAGDIAVVGRPGVPGQAPGWQLEVFARGSPQPASRRRIIHFRVPSSG